MITVRVLLLLVAFICLLLSAVGVQSRINLQSAGLASLVLSMLLGAMLP